MIILNSHNEQINKLYFDDETGFCPEKSHPNFINHFVDDFYYNNEDEESPFGSDTAFDAFSILVERIKEEESFDFSDFPRRLIENIWHMKYILINSLHEKDVKILLELDGTNVIQSDIVTCAVAFGQIKITGKLDKKLKENALSSLKRRNLTAKILDWGSESEILAKMIADISSFNEVI